jgi:hypothetical protein
MEVSKPHAQMRAVERYGREFHLGIICRIIREGKAKFVGPCKKGGATYDVPYTERNGTVTIVRVVVNDTKNVVLTVLPRKYGIEVARERFAELDTRARKRKQEFFKRFEDDEEELVTV